MKAKTERVILAIDQGTTNSKALLVNAGGVVVCEASRPVQVFYPKPGWVEQDPGELWQTVQSAAEEVLRDFNGEVAAVAVTKPAGIGPGVGAVQRAAPGAVCQLAVPALGGAVRGTARA
jgi:glycerol kinase